MKNKGLLIYIASVILSLVGISYYGGPVTYVFFFMVLLIPVISFTYIACVIASIKIFQRTDGRDMVSGTPSDFYITIENEGWFTFSFLRIIFYSSFSSITDIDDGVAYELLPHTSLTRKTKLLCRYRGEYEVGIKQIVVGDFLGIFRVTYRIREPLNVIVSPAIVHLDHTIGKELLSQTDRDNYRKKTEPDIPVREYIEGDDIRYMNHKATALMQKLMIKERKGEEKSGIAIVMDPGRYSTDMEDYLPAENKVMEMALALPMYYLEKRIPVDVITMDTSIHKSMVRDTGDMDALYELMRSYSFSQENDLSRLFDELYAAYGLYGYRELVFIMQGGSFDHTDRLKTVNPDNVPVRIYLIGKDNEADEDMITEHDIDIVRLGV